MLKILYIILVALLFQCPLTCSAQVTNDARPGTLAPGIQQWFPGWYITLQDDTVKGYIYLSNQIDNQVLFKFANRLSPALNEKTFEATAVKGYRVKDRVYESLLIETDKGSSAAFVRRIETGRLNLFAWYDLPDNGSMHDGSHNRPVTVNDEKFHEMAFMLRIGNGKSMPAPAADDFAEVMSAVVADNIDLSNSIARKLKGYRYGDLLNIVQQYNAWFLTKH